MVPTVKCFMRQLNVLIIYRVEKWNFTILSLVTLMLKMSYRTNVTLKKNCLLL